MNCIHLKRESREFWKRDLCLTDLTVLVPLWSARRHVLRKIKESVIVKDMVHAVYNLDER